MKTTRTSSWTAPARAIAVAAAVVSAALPLIAQSQDDTRSAQEIYRQDRADCMAGNTSQSKADCLYEARSALRDRTHGDPNLDDSNDAQVAAAADGMSTSSAITVASSDTTSTSTGSSDTTELAPQADRN